MGGGATFRFTFPGDGSFGYRCDFHLEMTGVVTVSASSSAAAPPPPPPSQGATASPAPPPAPAPAAAPAAGAGTASPTTRSVAIADFAYRPAAIGAVVGDTIVWTNNGSAPHTVTGSGLDSGRMNAGARFSTVVRNEGTLTYRCDFHPDMVGSVTVGAASAPAGRAAAAAPVAAPSSPVAAAPAPAPPAAAPAVVNVEDFAFAPSPVTVATGGTVTWNFAGVAPHTVTGDGFDSGILQTGATFERAFAEAGTFEYSCLVHPDMKGVVEVDAALASTTSADTAAAEGTGIAASGTEPSSPYLLYGVIGGASILLATGVLLGGARRFLTAFS